MKPKKLLFAAATVLLLTAAAVSHAETKIKGPYKIEIIDEDAMTVRILKYTIPKGDRNKENIEIVVPAELDEYHVTEIGDNAFINQRRIGSVTIPEGVTSIGIKAFSGCDGITEINLPDSLTNIGNKAFSNCKQLRKIRIPAAVTASRQSATIHSRCATTCQRLRSTVNRTCLRSGTEC